ncbi:MAG: FAD-dependent protein [Sediminibacterium sp.]
MQKELSLKLTPSEAVDDGIINQYIARLLGKEEKDITGFHRIRQSIDARNRNQVWINISVKAFIDEPFYTRKISSILFNDVTNAKTRVIIVGAGPAGLFAALKLIEAGIQPIVLERGKDVRARRRDLATLNKEGIVNPESNYCFGEGGAGTYSDGKLYTRSSKRGDINRVLNLLCQFGADEKILYEAHPHIGTNKLPVIITAIRQQIIQCGGVFLFEKKVTNLIIEKNILKGVITADGDTITGDAAILATGHSARDIFYLFQKKELAIEAKPFALGVRIEHPQVLIDSIQYHCSLKEEHLPPASYGLVEQVNDRGVFSFCMCPGGIIAPAATNIGELVVNGWSPSKRNNPYANSGMVVQVELADAIKYLTENKIGEPAVKKDDPLALLYFQQAIEQVAFAAGGGNLQAPAQRMVDFCSNKLSAALPDCSYLPGTNSVDLRAVLPPFIYQSLQRGFAAFGKKMSGYYTNEAILVATESRTSSPVRIPRDQESLVHPQVINLYPCGEGAGYAGGIVSAAMDGERVAGIIIKKER